MTGAARLEPSRRVGAPITRVLIAFSMALVVLGGPQFAGAQNAAAQAAAAQIATAQEPSCPLANEKPMLVTQLFFGLSMRGRGPVTPHEWAEFLRRNVTPRFPDGFTVYEAMGQWLDPHSRAVVRERSKVVVIAADDTAEVHTKIAAVSDLYRKAFHQQSVGVITRTECAAF
jgi:hypothetical protein